MLVYQRVYKSVCGFEDAAHHWMFGVLNVQTNLHGAESKPVILWMGQRNPAPVGRWFIPF